MLLREKLIIFDGALSAATAYPPDDYPDRSFINYEAHMADLRELWAEICVQLKEDPDKVKYIDGILQEAFAAFNAKEKDKGRKAILAIYNLDVTKLR